jgi:lipase (class 3)
MECLTTSAVPHVSPVPPPANLSFTRILSASPIDLPRFNLFEQYSAAAYDKAITSSDAFPADEVKIKVRCTAHNCPLVESGDAILYLAFEKPDPVNVAGFVAVDRTNQVIILSFRGTYTTSSEYSNLLEDVHFWFTDWSQVCDGCEAHNGFSTAWQNITDEAVSAILAAGFEFPGYSLVITGHSYGAAVATLATADLRHAGYTCTLVHILPNLPQFPFKKRQPILTTNTVQLRLASSW